MINVLSYVGMNMQSEVCLWTLLGLIRIIFDATLFKVNANLKQVWQMSMPVEISLPVQRMLRTIISGVMLVQCFTVYVYLASYIVLLYPVFLEERPALVLPWLLLAAVRQLLCELLSLALGLGSCVLLGPARPPCIKFVIVKLVSIMPAFYMWMLVFSYYHALKVAAAFKTFPVVIPTSDHDYGLELAIRRRRTKSLLGEDQLRCKLVARLYEERPSSIEPNPPQLEVLPIIRLPTDASTEDFKADIDILRPISVISHRPSETGSVEDWYGTDVVVPRDTDRILEQFVLMMLQIGVYLKKEGITYLDTELLKNKSTPSTMCPRENLNCTTIPPANTDTPPQVGSQGNTASYVREYPQIFMKKTSDLHRPSETNGNRQIERKVVQTSVENEDNGIIRTREKKRTVSISPNERVSIEIEKIVSRKIYSTELQQNAPTNSTENKFQVKDITEITDSDDQELETECFKQSKVVTENGLKISESVESLISLLNISSEYNKALKENKQQNNSSNEDSTSSIDKNKPNSSEK